MLKITIPNWAKFNPRSDRANYSWFRLENNFFHDQAIFGLTDSQKVLYLFLLCEASKKNSGDLIIRPNYLVALTGADQKKIDKDIKALVDCGLLTAERRQDAVIEPSLLPATNERTNVTYEVTPSAGDEVFVSKWNEWSKSSGLVSCHGLSKKRSEAIRARLKEKPDLVYWDSVMRIMANSKFLTGKIPPSGGREKPFRADIDFLLRPDTHLRVIEGKYGSTSAPTPPPASEIPPQGVPDVEDPVYASEEERQAAVEKFLAETRLRFPPKESRAANGK